jgi:hypothetical protein
MVGTGVILAQFNVFNSTFLETVHKPPDSRPKERFRQAGTMIANKKKITFY